MFLIWRIFHPALGFFRVPKDENFGSESYTRQQILLERLKQRHRDRQSSTTACPGCWATGTNKVKKCAVRKIIFCTGLTRAAKAGQKSIVPARKAQRTNQGMTSFICTPRVPVCLSFDSQQGPPLSGLSGCKP